jgi:hypothetical protein
VRQPLDFLQKGFPTLRILPDSGRANRNYANRIEKRQNAGDLACCDLLLLIEKSPLTEKHLKQQILNAKPISALRGRGVGIAFCNPNGWYHIC